jgi:ATP-dependent Lon protease
VLASRKNNKSGGFEDLILPAEVASIDKPVEVGPITTSTIPGQPGVTAPNIPDNLPILPIRGQVIFPGTVMPLTIGRNSSRQLLDENLPKSKIIGVLTQREEKDEDPKPDALYKVGTAVMVLKLIRQTDDTVSLIIHGLRRIEVQEFTQETPYLRARVKTLSDVSATGKNFQAAVNQLRESARQLIEMAPNAPEQAQTVLMNIDEPGNLADFLAANLNLDIQAKQDLLEETDIAKRLRLVHHHVSTQLEIVKLQQKIQQDVQSSIGDTQRQYYLREQLKAIQKELGEDGDQGGNSQVQQLREKLQKANPPEKVMEEAERELGRLANIPSASPEHSLIVTYLELIAGLPWSKKSQDNLDLPRARRILDRDHFDLDKVKRRLVEYLAVRKLNPDGRGPILCLVGPPGVGKTSLGQSIADALGRQFARLSFGGIRDEAEIRGHRRTYIGAMPGRIIQELRRAGTANPIMMLDEIDKLGSDFRGDPASALLEVLDPRQNHAFVDRYLDLPYDLSQVIFIATANYVGNIPPALLDRMELIDIPGYTDEDKLQIAQRYLVPRQLKENGLSRAHCLWTPSGVRKVIADYTREAGVRELERQIGSVCRSVASDIAHLAKSAPVLEMPSKSNGQTVEPTPATAKGKTKDKKKKITLSNGLIIPAGTHYVIDPKYVRKTLGSEKFFRESDEKITTPGLVIGLAYTPVGGEILFIEAALYPGKGGVILTGQIGDVMKESATAALSLFKSRAQDYGFDSRQLADKDLHIHVPAGAVPKDGPSAGIAMYTAIASMLLNKPVKQHLAMTGEITLRGRVMPIGGVKEKTLAAMRAGVRTILLPEENRRDMEEIHPTVKKRCKFIFVSQADQVLHEALGVAPPVKRPIKKSPVKNKPDLTGHGHHGQQNVRT